MEVDVLFPQDLTFESLFPNFIISKFICSGVLGDIASLKVANVGSSLFYYNNKILFVGRQSDGNNIRNCYMAVFNTSW